MFLFAPGMSGRFFSKLGVYIMRPGVVVWFALCLFHEKNQPVMGFNHFVTSAYALCLNTGGLVAAAPAFKPDLSENRVVVDHSGFIQPLL